MSLKSLKKEKKKDEEIISVTRKEKSLLLTDRKLSQLHRLASKMTSAQNFFLKKFSSYEFLGLVNRPRLLRDQYVKEGLPPELANLQLQARQWKLCLDKAFETLASARAITAKAVEQSIKNSKLSEKEVHLARYVMQRPDLLQLILEGKMSRALSLFEDCSNHSHFNSSLKDALGAIDIRHVFQWLRRRYRECHSRNRKPLIRKKRTYHLDPDMYSFLKKGNRSYLCVASLEPRQRISIPLINSNLVKEDFSGDVKVVLRPDGKVEVHRAIHCIVKAVKKRTALSDDLKVSAVDKGFTDLLHCTSGQKYGRGYGQKMTQWSDSLQKTHSGRARMQALIRENEKKIAKLSNDPSQNQERHRLIKKNERIRENNLGSKKLNHKRESTKSKICKEIGTAVNQLFRTEKPEVLGVESLKFDGYSFFGKRTNRLLKTWHKGLLQDALVKGAKMNCVQLEETNPAYTSQLCRSCGAVDAKNRKGDGFACVHCRHKADANFAVSLNIRDRIFDSEIGLYIPHKQVKEILIERHRLRLSSLGLKANGLSSSANYLILESNDPVHI